MPIQMFPDCEYVLTAASLSGEDEVVYRAVQQLAKTCRSLFKELVIGDITRVAAVYNDIHTHFPDISELPPCPWSPELEIFFTSLAEFLNVKFIAKESNESQQREYETSAAEILSRSCSEHTHAGCPYHLEDNFTHCCMCMLRILSRHHSFNERDLFRKGVCALFHDIGKQNTHTASSNGRVGYPCHCLAGSITLRHMWGSHYLPWFSADEYDAMCDLVLYHMCGMNMGPSPISITGLSMLPAALRADLGDLAIADRTGAFPERAHLSDVLCLAEDEVALAEMDNLATNSSLTGMLLL